MLPVFVAVLFGMIDYGWYFYQRSALHNAVRDGVRYGVAQPNTSDAPWLAARTRAKTDIAASNVPVPADAAFGPPTHVTDGMLTLNVTTTFTPLIGFVRLPPTMFASVTMMLEFP